jgi:hypothetical protein
MAEIRETPRVPLIRPQRQSQKVNDGKRHREQPKQSHTHQDEEQEQNDELHIDEYA